MINFIQPEKRNGNPSVEQGGRKKTCNLGQEEERVMVSYTEKRRDFCELEESSIEDPRLKDKGKNLPVGL